MHKDWRVRYVYLTSLGGEKQDVYGYYRTRFVAWLNMHSLLLLSRVSEAWREHFNGTTWEEAKGSE